MKAEFQRKVLICNKILERLKEESISSAGLAKLQHFESWVSFGFIR